MADGLINSFNETNLDLENPLPNGGPIKYPVPAYFSPNATGTPNKTSSPGPFKGFTQPYTPQNPYLSNISNRIIGTSMLSDNENDPSVLSITNLDNTKPGVDGGIPYKQDKDPTSYPESVSGTPTTTRNPGPAEKFDQPYNPQNPYLSKSNINNKIIKASMLSDNENSPSVLSITSLDNTKEGVNGGVPYKTVDDPTVYPPSTKAVSPIRGYFSEPGVVAQKYGSNTQVYSSTNTYTEFISSYI